MLARSIKLTRGFLWLLAIGHGVAFLWLCSDWNRNRLLVFRTHEVASEADVIRSPQELARFAYTQDDPAALADFREIAERVVAGATSDGERLRRIGDYMYGLRVADSQWIVPGEHGYRLTRMFLDMQQGTWGNCGHMVWVMMAMLRSMGYDVRQVIWFTPTGGARHAALEVYSTQGSTAGRWLYYDVNLNGYGADQDGAPLSIAALRSNILTREDLHLVYNDDAQDWDRDTFLRSIREYPNDWYVMNNALLYYEPGQRFGSARKAYDLLAGLPYPLDRIADNVFGVRETRLVIAGRMTTGGWLTVAGLRVALMYSLVMTALALTLQGVWLVSHGRADGGLVAASTVAPAESR